MRKLSVAFLLVIAAVLPVQCRAQSGAQAAQAKRPMTFEDMMQMKRLGETAVSQDGKWLAYSVTTVNLDQNTKTAELWLQAIAGGEPFKLAVGQTGDSGPQFAPDGKRILFLSGRENGQQIWVADFDAATGATSDAKKLTSIATEADNAKWSPDAKSIVFTSAVYPDCPAVSPADGGVGDKCNADRDAALAASKVKAQIWTHLMYRHWDHYTGNKRFHLFQVLVDGSGMRDLNPGDTHDVPPFSLEGGGCGCDISPDSKELAFTEKLVDDDATSTNADIFALDLTDPSAKPVKVSTSPGGDFNPAYSPDGKYLAWRSQERAGYESDKFRLVVYDRATKTIKEMMPGFDQWVDEFAWDPRSFAIHAASSYQGETQLNTVDIPQGSYVTMGATEGEFSDLKLSSDGLFLIATAMHVTAPPEAVIFDLHRVHMITDRSRTLGALGHTINPDRQYTSAIVFDEYALTHLNDALLAQLDLPKMESFWFTAKDGTKLQGFIIRPRGFDAAKKYPVKFLIHGGPQGNWGDDWSYRWNAELFAANGYVVVMINMRGSTGYGQAIVDSVNGDWGGKPFTDLMEGLDYAEQHYSFIDKDRECALGASYGGFMANWVLGHTDRFKCIVSHDGMFNAESAFGSTEEDWFNIWEFKGHPWDYYGKPDAENPFRKWSPSLSAKNFKTPTLVIHGQLDYRLDVSEGFQLFDTLQVLGVPSKMLYFPNEGHWVLKPQDSRLWWKTVNDWVDEWLKTGTRD
jgi:dipeptidyl aminopeptidase/acylaminoacyl peptidase